ncbi:MAG TPA: efflux RND transporter permease subunit [Dissulfurispiraceae bacterium]|nr:efflux RND transporter permease subunit [Dissulfurispiraceae bacterium]
MNKTGISGRIAGAFINSKLTPLIVAAALLLGIFAVIVTPREEEPQILVPMIDVMVAYPGASAAEVDARVTRPMERLLWEIKGVEYVYSIARPGSNLTIVRFYVGENMEDSIVKVYNKLMSHYDIIPPGVSQPIVKPKSIDDVPVLALTLWSKDGRYSGYELRRMAAELSGEIKKDKDVSEFTLIGGQKRQVRLTVDPSRLKAYQVSPLQIMDSLQKANFILPSGSFPSGNRELLVRTGAFLRNAEEAGSVVVAAYNNRPVYLRDVAQITDGPEEPADYVFIGLGPSAAKKGILSATSGEHEAVTVAISKKKGANASIVANDALKKVDALRGSLLPSDVQVTVTRNYGETAKEKSDELLEHMMIATISVVILVALALGWRESVVVAVAVPVTLGLTLLINYLYGYTLNRVTLFALIFSIGILVDDAIVVVENVHRHFKLHGASIGTAISAVDEVGNPTILATFTVIAALLPMAFVSGLMGPYMRPIPVGASAAMLFSLLVAFIVSPWLGYKVLKNAPHTKSETEGSRLHAFYEKVLGPMLGNRRKRLLGLGAVAFMLGLAVLLVPFKMVTVKMLPFDNKSELQVIIDMPEGVALEQTAALVREMGDYLKTVPEVTDYESYIGTASPYNFNGLVRHYFMRSGSNVADIQVNFVAKDERSSQSHDIAKRLRPGLKAIGDRYGANIKLAEIPPGPPVLDTLVAEVYGPDPNRQIEIAAQIKEVFKSTPGVVDVDWYVEADREKMTFDVDRDKAALNGVSTETAARTLRIALSGMGAGLVHLDKEEEPVELFVRMPMRERSLSSLKEVSVPSASGALIPLSELVTVRPGIEDRTIYHKNLRRTTYVIGDLAGTEESPVYAILKMKEKIKELRLPEGYELKQYSTTQPQLEQQYAIKWDGEWHITYEVFRDLGIAFAAVLILIYILVVAWFRSFLIPLIIMAPIPLTLVGILPGHWMFGAFFTATSMIGFIALSGIIVRNSILLVDFIQMEWRECGDLKSAVIRAGAVRFRPIVLTAAAVVVGSFVILFDPIFQGLAIAMMFGAISATGLTLVAVPVLYYELYSNRPCPEKPGN